MRGNELTPARRRSLPPAAALCVALALAFLFLASCRSATRDHVRVGWSERGEASWYGYPFHGQRTASGERYDMYLMTAAHRELPIGTVVEVTNRANGRRVQVRINDRGPFVRGRILDLSYGAATELDMVRTGTADIELRVVEMGEQILPLDTVLTVQVGAFQTRERADALLAKLAGDFADARIEESLPWYRVRVGTYTAFAEAEQMQKQLLRRGYRSIVLRAGLGPVLSE